MRFRMRPARSDESDLLFDLHRDAMQDLVCAVFGEWNDAVQRDLHNAWFEPDQVQVVEVDGRPVGMIAVSWSGEHIEVHRIEIEAAHRDRGLGTELLSSILAEADLRGRSTAIEVFRINRAHQLYERLGFHEVSRDDAKIYLMRPSRQ